MGNRRGRGTVKKLNHGGNMEQHGQNVTSYHVGLASGVAPGGHAGSRRHSDPESTGINDTQSGYYWMACKKENMPK